MDGIQIWICKSVRKLVLWKKYTPKIPKIYYDAINVNKKAEIPCDYDGVMGVPITFMDKYNPEQFEYLASIGNTRAVVTYYFA